MTVIENKVGVITKDKERYINIALKHFNDSWRGRTLKHTVLRMIWKEHRISRAEIAKRLGLSRSTVTEIVKDLLKTDLVAEVGIGESSGGRKPILLEFQYEAKGILGIDIGATHVSVALTDLRGGLLDWKEQMHSVRSDPNGTRKLVFKLCDACIANWKHKTNELLSIGVSLPSPVDRMNPEWLSEVVIPAWQGRSEMEHLQQRYGVPVHIDNDANLGALAEYFWGAGNESKNLVYLKLGFGIGAGFIIEGEIYRGAVGVAGEMGHIPIDLYGKQCICGLRGCLVTFVGAEALEARASELLTDYSESTLGDKEINIAAVEDAALQDDKLALRVIREAAEYLGIAIAGWLNIMNPDMVVLGGSLAKVGEILLEPIRQKIKQCTLLNSVSSVEIRSSKLGPKTVALGAATLALEESFADYNLFNDDLRTGFL